MKVKVEEEKIRFGQMHFHPFIPIQSSYLTGAMAQKLPVSNKVTLVTGKLWKLPK